MNSSENRAANRSEIAFSSTLDGGAQSLGNAGSRSGPIARISANVGNVGPTVLALSREAAPIGLTLARPRTPKAAGTRRSTTRMWLHGLVELQRLYGQPARSLRIFEASGICALRLRICSAKRSNAYQLDFEPPGALVFAALL